MERPAAALNPLTESSNESGYLSCLDINHHCVILRPHVQYVPRFVNSLDYDGNKDLCVLCQTVVKMDVSLEIKAKRPFPDSFDMEDKPHIRRRKVELRSWQNLPDSFSDNDLVAALHGRKDFSCCEKFPLVCGILIKLRSGFFRVYKRSMCKFPRVAEEDWPRQFYDVAKLLTYDSARLEEEWTVDQLWKGAETLVVKSCNLSIRLQRDLSIHPLYPLDPTTGLLQFHAEFLVRVAEYHESLRRPEGTFELPDSPLIQTLLDVPRIRCNACDGVRQLYCGPCGGLRMSNAESILPPRINLPFDVLLILHW